MNFVVIFSISALLFVLNVAEIRIFSFLSWHYITYLLVPFATFGGMAAGLWFAARKNVEDLSKYCYKHSILFAFSVFIAFFAASKIPLDALMGNKVLLIVFFVFDLIFLFLPHFFAGLIVVSIFRKYSRSVNICCAFLSFGAATASFFVFDLMSCFNIETLICIAVTCSAAVSLMLVLPQKKQLGKKIFSLVLILISLAFYPLKEQIFLFYPARTKVLNLVSEPNVKPEFTKWGKTGRIDIVKGEKITSDDYFPDAKRGVLTIDGVASRILYDFSEERESIAASLFSTGYFGLERPEVFIAGLSSPDIAAAFFWGAESVEIAEPEEAVSDAFEWKYSSLAVNLMKNPQLSVKNLGIRGFLEKNGKKYDLIQIPLLDSYTAQIGAFYVSNENFLYTEEAFSSYLDHLKPNGNLAVMRHTLWPPREMLKMAATAYFALRKAGISAPEKNILIIGNGLLATMLVRKTAFSWTELNRLNDMLNSLPDLRIIYAPGFSANSIYYAPLFSNTIFSSDYGENFIERAFYGFFADAKEGSEEDFFAGYSFDVRPSKDDSPYFENYFKLGSKEFFDGSLFEISFLVLAVVLSLFFVLSALFSSAFLVEKEKRKFSFLSGFASVSLGCGWVFLVAAFSQKLAIFLKNPMISIVFILGFFLLFSGIAALFSKKLLIFIGEKRLFSLLSIFIPLMILSYLFILPYFSDFYLNFALASRFFAVILFLFPPAFFTGLIFPAFLVVVREKNECFSSAVLGINFGGKIAALAFFSFISMSYGLNFAIVIAAFCYFFAIFAMNSASSS